MSLLAAAMLSAARCSDSLSVLATLFADQTQPAPCLFSGGGIVPNKQRLPWTLGSDGGGGRASPLVLMMHSMPVSFSSLGSFSD